MITINGKQIEKHHFPDGTQRLTDIPFCEYFDKNGHIDDLEVWEFDTHYDNSDYDRMLITWKYESDEELFTLYCIVRHIKENFKGHFSRLDLQLEYIPNARMDRVKSRSEVFTLKYFCEIINRMGFDNVYVLDPHSDVSVALINNVRILPFTNIFDDFIVDVFSQKEKDKSFKDNVVFYAPDAGACKRYSSLLCDYNIPFVHGEKKRDWKTGKIEGLDIVTNGVDLNGKIAVMFDDIISYGGTLYYSAKELKKAGVSKIYAFVTHTENSVFSKNGTFKKCLDDGTVECLCTTDSLIDVDAIPDKYKDKVIII